MSVLKTAELVKTPVSHTLKHITGEACEIARGNPFFFWGCIGTCTPLLQLKMWPIGVFKADFAPCGLKESTRENFDTDLKQTRNRDIFRRRKMAALGYCYGSLSCSLWWNGSGKGYVKGKRPGAGDLPVWQNWQLAFNATKGFEFFETKWTKRER